MTGKDNGHDLGCSSLANTPDAQLYENCRGIMTEMGFDFADAWYDLYFRELGICSCKLHLL